MRILFYLVAMTTLGAIAMSCFAALVDFRTGQPVEAAHDTSPGSAELLSAATDGLYVSAAAARRSLEDGERSEAVHALDSAIRAAGVLDDAVRGTLQGVSHVSKTLYDAKRALANGRPALAGRYLAEAETPLRAVSGTGIGALSFPGESDWPRYRGATVPNANGVRIGEIESVERSGDVLLYLGGGRDLLGFLDLGGVPHTVAVDELLWGAPRKIGGTHVLLPRQVSPAAITRAAGSSEE